MNLRPRDIALSVGVAVLQVGGTLGAAQDQPDRQDLDAVGIALLLIGPVALLWRRSRPAVPLSVSLTALLAFLALDYPYGPVVLAFVISLVNCVLRGQRTAALLAAGVVELNLLITLWVGEIHLGEAIGGTAWLLVVLAVSEVVRSRRDGRAQARAAIEQQTLRRAGEERLLVARELHDVLAHSISLISVQAGVALHLMDDQPDKAREALTAIRAASTDGLRDLRRTIGVLREDAALAPTPELSALPGLLAGARASGLTVSLAEHGTPRPVATPVAAAAYRIVQESLTNVTRHCAGKVARVSLCYGDELVVTVDDDGPAAPSGVGGGHGLQGMRERVSALGGRLTTGPRGDGGFSVRAVLPSSDLPVRLPGPHRTGHHPPGRAHRPRTRGGRAGRRGAVQRRDRRPAVPVPHHSQDARQSRDGQARGTRPRPAGRAGVRERAGAARLE